MDAFVPVPDELLDEFRLIYHQTTPFSNALIEAVLYRSGKGTMFLAGDIKDANYVIVHRSGFAHINLTRDDDEAFGVLDAHLAETSGLPPYLMLYHTPATLLTHWEESRTDGLRIRQRRRYELDTRQFIAIAPESYAPPAGHSLRELRDCPARDLDTFDLALGSRFFDDMDDFLTNSFGYVLYDEQMRPVCIAYSTGVVGRTAEADLKTHVESRGRGYGYVTISNYVRESIRRGVNVGWDCFIDNHSDGWARRYGYTSFREYNFVTFPRQ